MDSSRSIPFRNKIGVWLLLLAGGFLFCRYLLPCLLPFLLGYAIAYLLRPAVLFCTSHGWKHTPACYLVSGIFYLFFGYLVWLLGALTIGKLSTFATALPQLYHEYFAPVLAGLEQLALSTLSLLEPSVQTALQEFFQWGQSGMGNLFTTLSSSLLESLTTFARKLPLYALSIGFTVVSSVMISTDYRRISSFLAAKLPRSLLALCKEIRNFFVQITGRLAGAYLLIMGITFLELSLGLWLLGFSSFWKIALAIAFLDLLPILGSGIVLVPWGIWVVLGGNLAQGVGILLLFGVVALVRSFLEPKIVGDRTGLHPLATLISMYCGIRLLGFGGILLAPLLLMLFCHLHKKGMLPYSR